MSTEQDYVLKLQARICRLEYLYNEGRKCEMYRDMCNEADIFKETPAQSVAHIKAAVLRSFADELDWYVGELLRGEADRLERGESVLPCLARTPAQSVAHIEAAALERHAGVLMSIVGGDNSPETNEYYSSAAEDALQAAAETRKRAPS